MAQDNFGVGFSAKVERNTWGKAVTPAITNDYHEGEIKQMGDRLRILMMLGAVSLQDYVSGTDMSSVSPVDDEVELVVEKRKAWNFVIDRLEQLFAYAMDVPDAVSEKYTKQLEREIDTYTLSKMVDAKNWIGYNLRVTGSSRDTEASIATTSTGGTVTINAGTAGGAGTVELGDGTSAFANFHATDVGKYIRLTSGTSWATDWYRITAVTDTVTATVVNWDNATAGDDIPTGDVLRGLAGNVDFTGGVFNGDGKPTTEGGWGYELMAAFATSLTSANIYGHVVLGSEALDREEVPDTDRHFTVTPSVSTLLRNASELQPAISMAYEGVVINGRVGRVGGIDIHMAAGQRVSTRVEHPTSSGQGTDITVTAGDRALQLPINHKDFCTFAYKWAESRVVDAEDQFARKYQGLHLFGAVVPNIRRKAGVVLFGIV